MQVCYFAAGISRSFALSFAGRNLVMKGDSVRGVHVHTVPRLTQMPKLESTGGVVCSGHAGLRQGRRYPSDN